MPVPGASSHCRVAAGETVISAVFVLVRPASSVTVSLTGTMRAARRQRSGGWRVLVGAGGAVTEVPGPGDHGAVGIAAQVDEGAFQRGAGHREVGRRRAVGRQRQVTVLVREPCSALVVGHGQLDAELAAPAKAWLGFLALAPSPSPNSQAKFVTWPSSLLRSVKVAVRALQALLKSAVGATSVSPGSLGPSFPHPSGCAEHHRGTPQVQRSNRSHSSYSALKGNGIVGAGLSLPRPLGLPAGGEPPAGPASLAQHFPVLMARRSRAPPAPGR